MSGLDTGDALVQASHAAELAEQEGWDKVIGIGYSDNLRRGSQHVGAARSPVR